jgi:ribonuclease T1
LRWLAVALAAAASPLADVAARETAPAPQAIALSQLPAEAHATLRLIRQGGPFPYRKDGVVFHNRENQLPPRRRGWYREYTVPTPGSRDRGARRIIAGEDGLFYYSDDHYRSFRRIRE